MFAQVFVESVFTQIHPGYVHLEHQDQEPGAIHQFKCRMVHTTVVPREASGKRVTSTCFDIAWACTSNPLSQCLPWLPSGSRIRADSPLPARSRPCAACCLSQAARPGDPPAPGFARLLSERHNTIRSLLFPLARAMVLRWATAPPLLKQSGRACPGLKGSPLSILALSACSFTEVQQEEKQRGMGRWCERSPQCHVAFFSGPTPHENTGPGQM